jgi:hypothetical protein
VKALLKGVAKIGCFAKIIREHLDKGIPETRPSSHPSVPYLSSRAESFHNQRHKSFGVGKAFSFRKHTFF